jgi:exopolyphosphatase/guanosine-5'-triphosphate,3'-diphosphate pyrophosphatase
LVQIHPPEGKSPYDCMQPLASIDVGSNTLRLLIAEKAASGSPRPIQAERRITRLGEHFLPSKTLQAPAMARSIAALEEFAELMDRRGVTDYLAGATAVVRESANGGEFLRMIRARTGLEVRLLDGAEEAKLSLWGVSSVIPKADRFKAVFDIGGGSTELVWEPEVESISLPLGVVHLTEIFLQDDPPGAEACMSLRRHVRDVLNKESFPADLSARLWVGTAGTATTLASLYLALERYDPERVNGTVLERAWLVDLCHRLAGLTIAQRSKLTGLEPGREDIILAGGLLILEFMDIFDYDQFWVSDAGLLEGLFLELCQMVI